MNQAYFKSLFREIRQSAGRFLSIMAISALGTSFFAGIKASAPDMENTADAHFDTWNVQDIQVMSTLGLNQDDLEAISSLDGVSQAQPGFSLDALTRRKSSELTVRVIALDNDQSINQPRLIEGRLPEAPDECVLQADSMTSSLQGSFGLGDRITLYDDQEAPLDDSLTTSTFIVVGKAYNPNYLSYELGSSSTGSGSVDTFIYVPWQAIKADYYTEIDVTVQNAATVNTYGDDYFPLVDPVVDEIEKIASTQIQKNIAEKQKQIDEAKKKMEAQLTSADIVLSSQKKQLDQAAAQIQSGLAQLINGKERLSSSRAELDAGWAQYNSSAAQLENGLAQIDQGIAAIEQAQNQLPQLLAQKKELETALTMLPVLNNAASSFEKLQAQYNDLLWQIEQAKQENPQDPVPPALLQALDELETAIDQAIASFTNQPGLTLEQAFAWVIAQRDTLLEQIGSQQQGEAMLEQLEQGIAQIESAQEQLAQLQNQKQALLQSQKQLAQAKATLESSELALAQGTRELATQEAVLENGQQSYESGKAQLDKAKNELEEQKSEGQKQIDASQQQLDALDGQWYVLDRNSHYSWRDYQSTAQRMDGIASVFPVFFFLVAALVCMTTMTRMVEEERQEMGTLKALGYSRKQIAFKYLFYAGAASLCGSIIGCAFGMILFPYVIFTAWNTMYNLESIQFLLQPLLALLACASVTGIVLLATLLSIARSTLEVPAALMRPKAGKAGKKILLERIRPLWKRVPFLYKVTLRNLFRYKKRFLMTVIGIAGCSALLVAGFGLNDSIGDIVDAQYGRIYHYDGSVGIDLADHPEVISEIQQLAGIQETYCLQTLPVTIQYDDRDVDANLNILDDEELFQDFMTFYPMMNSAPNFTLNGGAFISIKTAEKMNLSCGDLIDFSVNGKTVSIPVTGIFEQYVNHQIYIDESTFETLNIGQDPSATLLIVENNPDPALENELGSQLMNLDGVRSVAFYSSLKTTFLNMISSIRMIVVVLVASAALLAFVVLYNLSNVNISERMREIATIKVLGFTQKEVSQYVNRETLLLSLIGAGLGLFLGIFLHGMIMNLAELDTIRFGRAIYPLSYVISFGLTIFFTLVVNWVMTFKLNKIQMVESLKAVE